MMPDEMHIRRMTRDELDVLVEWAAREGWNPGLDDAEVFWKARAGSFYADAKIDWLDAYREQLKAAVRWPAPGQQAAE